MLRGEEFGLILVHLGGVSRGRYSWPQQQNTGFLQGDALQNIMSEFPDRSAARFRHLAFKCLEGISKNGLAWENTCFAEMDCVFFFLKEINYCARILASLAYFLNIWSK